MVFVTSGGERGLNRERQLGEDFCTTKVTENASFDSGEKHNNLRD
jgi:hypothetical protein